jgi:putative radical SAM enzyme (TIGR03279 family)
MKSSGVDIEMVAPGSIGAAAGLLAGDRLISINGGRIRDSIDLLYYGNEPDLDILMGRGSETRHVAIKTAGGASNLGIVLKPFTMKKCTNRCIFCFVAQLPKGMRKTLYAKDEDYRLSFLYGNYITLTSLTDGERKRIVEQHLSPLYISVHSTDTEIRNRMLGNPKAGDILKDLRFFAEHNIRMHAQIVLCPGYNDGREMARTINDLYKFYPYVQSIAVVPVGLTTHRKKVLRPVEKGDALSALETISRFQTRLKRKHGEHIVFAADELYIKAGTEFPSLKDYDELSQIENGVGLVPQFLSQAKRLKIQAPDKIKKRKFVTLTGISFYPFLAKFVERIRKRGFDIEAFPVDNVYFGNGVTVTGLLTGRDVMRALSGHIHSEDILIIPDVVMKEGHEVFLDDVSRQEIEEILGVKSVIIESTPSGIMDAVLELSK